MSASYPIKPSPEKLVEIFHAHVGTISSFDSPAIKRLRQQAIKSFIRQGFPTTQIEEWRSTSLESVLEREYHFQFAPPAEKADIHTLFQCEIHNFETYLFTQLNGWYLYEKAPLTKMPDGTIIGSLREAMKVYPDLFSKHYGKYAACTRNGLISLNTAFAQDGIFIRVPDNTRVEKPIQLVNIVSAPESLFLQPRHLILVGKNSALTLVQCDDSLRHENSLINGVTEVFVDENGTFEQYKLQNKDTGSTVITSLYIHQHHRSKVNAYTLTLNGGLIRNDINVALNGQHGETCLYGLYLADRTQHVDNQVYVSHNQPDNTSLQLYKGIIDDNASAVFNGHILVQKNAQRTSAYQTNRNILLTDKARVTAKPFLEIYADDVKCSHGVTVGQLDPEALFYLRSRGICERNARMLLMYAFAAEVINHVKIEALRNRLDIMVQKRLRGELTLCDQCVLHCKDANALTFEIDMSKV